jgi:hypothetical protein
MLYTNRKRSHIQGGKIIRAANGHVVGQVRGDVFCKTIKPNHYLKKPPAIAFDICTLDDAEAAGATHVEVTDRESGLVYRASIAHIRAKGFEFDRGWGDQIGLHLSGWTKRQIGGPIQLKMEGVK